MMAKLKTEFAFIPMKTADTERWVWLRDVYRATQIVEITQGPINMIHFQDNIFEHLGNAVRAKRMFEHVCYRLEQEIPQEVL